MIKNKIVKGFFWNIAGVFGHGVGYIIITIILSRLLPPSDFGLIALLLVFSNISNVLVDGGFGQAIIRDKSISNDKLSSVFVFNVGIAATVYCILYFCSPVLCRFYNISEHLWETRVLFLIVVFEASALIQKTLLVKAMDFRWLTCAQCVATLIAGILSIAIAFMGGGSWSLVCYYLSFSLLQSVLLWCKRCEWKPTFRFHFAGIRQYMKFSINLLMTTFVDRIMGSLESVFIGKIYTKSDLAFFSRARDLDSWTGHKLIDVVIKVTYPALAQERDDREAFNRSYRNIMGITVFTNTFIMTFLIVAASNIIETLWGKAWLESETYVLPWCLFGIVFPFQSICINIFQAYGRTDQYLYISIARQFLRITAILLFAHISIISMTWAIISVAVFGTAIVLYYASKLINTNALHLLWDSKTTIIAAALSGIFTWGIGKFFHEYTAVLVLFIQGTTMLLCYYVLNALLKNPFLELMQKQIITPSFKKITALLRQ